MAHKMTDSNHTTYDGAKIKNYFFNHNYLHLFSIYYIISNGPAVKKEGLDMYKGPSISKSRVSIHAYMISPLRYYRVFDDTV